MSKVTKHSLIADLAKQGRTKVESFEVLRAMVESQTPPMVFKRNPTQAEKFSGQVHRVTLSMSEQLIALKDQIGRSYSALGLAASADFDSEEIPATPTVPVPAPAEDVPAPAPAEIQPEPEPEPEAEPEPETVAPRAKGKANVENQLERFRQEMRRIRDFADRRAEQSDPIDDLGNRPEKAARKLIPAGVPVEALVDLVTLTWTKDTRQDLGISSFDFRALSRKMGEDREIDMTGKHEMFPYVLTLVEEGIPVFLCGPQGSGKSTLCTQIADYLKLPYGETACSAGATRGDFYGRMTANPDKWFINSKFNEIHGSGGVFNFEEIDAALPEVLIALNNALAGEKFFNSSNGETYWMNPNARWMATGNTWGTGANPLYVARERLDSATLDRWRMGRCFIPFDQKLADDILFGRI